MELEPITQWKKGTQKKNKREEEKERIRKAFANAPEVEIIPATVQSASDFPVKLKVAAYCRVSTYEDTQAGSYELQLQHYREKIDANPEWELAGIYADEGVSGTSIKRRIAFMRMIDDCMTGKINLILTKSVSRFARNTKDCLDVARKLKALQPPVGILFETENFNTADSKNEFMLGVMSLIAQGESEQKSAAVLWSIIERFKKGIPIISTHNLLGYDKDRFGKMIIVEEEATVIRYIFSAYKSGQTTGQIARALSEAHVPTPRGKENWKSSSVRNILRNEKYCGDVLMQKTFTVDCFSHKKIKNTGQKPQYRLRNHHPPIVSREEWAEVQEALCQPGKRIKAEQHPLANQFYLQRVKSGSLKGFVVIDSKWRAKELEQFFEKLDLKNKGE